MQTFSTLIHCCCSLSCPHLSFGSELHWLQLQFRFQLQLPGVPFADATATATATDANAFASSCQSQTLTGARWGRRELQQKKKIENKQTAKNTLTNADNKLSKFCAYYPRKKKQEKTWQNATTFCTFAWHGVQFPLPLYLYLPLFLSSAGHLSSV